MPKADKKLQKAKKVLGVLAVLIVVGGVAVMGYLISSQKKPALKSPESGAISKEPAPSKLPFSLIMPSDEAVTVLTPEGKTERLSYSEFNERYKDAALPLVGALAANGEVRYMRLPLTTSTAALHHLSPDRKSEAWLAVAAKDGAGVIAIKTGNAKEEKMTLRSENKALTDALLLGWFDQNNLAVMAQANQAQSVYAVNLNGVIKKIWDLPENTIFFTAKGGYFWYATGVVGQGLESPPTGPSELFRLALNGTHESAVKDDKLTFVSVIPGLGGFLAMTMNDGNSYITQVGSGVAGIPMGKRRPLLFTRAGDLVARDGFDLVLMNSLSGKTTKLTTLPEGLVEVYVLNED